MRRDAKYRAAQLEPRVRRGFAQAEWRILLANGAAWGFPAAAEVIRKELGFDDGEALDFSYLAEHGTPEQWSTAFIAAANSPNTAPEAYALAECISLTGLGWDFLEPIKPDLKKRSQDALAEAASILAVPAEPLPTALPENDGSKEPGPSVAFTTLDQVIIDQIIATAAQSQGALSPDDLDDFLQTIISLSLKMARAYHHLGLADALLKDRHLDWQREEFNDERRGWYLVGALTAYVRRQKHELALELIRSRQQDFDALYQPGNLTGQFAANALSPYLLSRGMIVEAANLIGPHVGKYCVSAIRQLLVRSADLLRTGQVSDVSPVIEALFHAAPQLAAIPSHGASLLRMTNRLMAQVCQARGEFDPARMILTKLRDEQHTSLGSGILADLALVEAGIANVTDLKLPEEREARVQLRALLGNSESILRQSANGDLPSCRGCLALAVLDYLTWADSYSDTSSLMRALTTVRLALATVRATREGAVYQNSGLVGQCQFMEAVLLMNRLTDQDAQLAFTVWQGIPASAGHLPSIDVGLLLQAAQAAGQQLAAKLVESLVAYGRWDSNSFLRDPVMLTHSPALLERALASIDDTSLSDREKWDRLVAVVPAAVQRQQIDLAENALSYLQQLALHGSCLTVAREWFSQETNFKKVWDVDDATWIRAEIAHCQGDLADCGQLLAQLFWTENHRNRQAAEDILTVMQDWRIPGEIRDPCVFGLVETNSEQLPAVTDFERSRAFRIVFVGGNETQERYDEYVRETIAAEWPNVQVEFFHTGWSANWGRELSGIVKAANSADAVVIMRFVRTMFGRGLRSQITKPWFPCTGHGRASVLGTIERAIKHVARENAA